MNSGILINKSVGTVAAFLTAFEFLCSTLTALMARATIHGFWLLSLHRRRRAEMDARTRMHRVIRKDLFSFLLGVWIVISVALVEVNLEPTFMIHETPQLYDSKCVLISKHFNPEILRITNPTLKITMEKRDMIAAMFSRKCGKHGIAAIGTGGCTDITGRTVNMTAPTCSTHDPVPTSEVLINVTKLSAGDQSFNFYRRSNYVFELLPYSRVGVIKSVLNTTFPSAEGTVPCGTRNVSLYSTTIDALWATVTTNGPIVSATVLQTICRLHGNKPVNSLQKKDIASCFENPSLELDMSCVRAKVDTEQARNRYLNYVDLPDMAALFYGLRSFACVNSTVRYEYVFLDPAVPKEMYIATQRLEISPYMQYVLVPTRVRALGGHCEPTIGALARNALIYTADAEWSQDEMMKMDRLTRYHAFMIAISNSQFPMDKIDPFEIHTNETECFLHKISDATLLPFDWRYYMLFIGLSIAAVTCVTGAMFRFIYRGETWKVGSAHWSITNLLSRGQCERILPAIIEVVPVKDLEHASLDFLETGDGYRVFDPSENRPNTQQLSRRVSDSSRINPAKDCDNEDMGVEYRLRTAHSGHSRVRRLSSLFRFGIHNPQGRAQQLQERIVQTSEEESGFQRITS